MIGIIGAQKEEVNEIIKLIDIKNTYEEVGFKFYTGAIDDKEIVVMQSGIGKVTSAVSTTLLLKKYSIDTLINIGSAGGLLKDTQHQGDLVISSEVLHHDIETGKGSILGKAPGMPETFKADKQLLNATLKVVKDLNMNYHIGVVASGDQFIYRENQVNTITTNFPNALCCEMEAASIAQVAHIFNVPFIMVRSLSDVFGNGDISEQYESFLVKASENSAKLCFNLVKSL